MLLNGEGDLGNKRQRKRHRILRVQVGFREKTELGFELQTKGGDQKEVRDKRKSKINETRDGTNQSIMPILKLMGQAECNRWKQRRADQSSEEENIFPPFICNFY